jgi:hypothetical protein
MDELDEWLAGLTDQQRHDARRVIGERWDWWRGQFRGSGREYAVRSLTRAIGTWGLMDAIIGLLPDVLDMTHYMHAAIEKCASVLPHEIWDEIRRLAFESDLRETTGWFRSILAHSPPPADVNALWFGIWSPVGSNGRTLNDFHVGGSTSFGSTPDWMSRLEWLPRGRYRHSEVQRAIKLAADRAGDEEIAHALDYAIALGHVAASVMLTLEAVELGALPLRDAQLPVAVGFDSGDGLLVGRVVQDGFVRGDYSWV